MAVVSDPNTFVGADGITVLYGTLKAVSEGALLPSRYVGAVASGTPAAGTYSAGDWVVVLTGGIAVCTAPGTPGTWVAVGGGGSSPPIEATLAFNLPTGGAGTILIPNSLAGDGTFAGVGPAAAFSTGPLFYNAGAIVDLGTLTLATAGVIASTADALDLMISVFVQSASGANRAATQVVTQVPSPVTDTAKTLDLSTATWGIVAGADLSDDGGGTLTSAAGGVYNIFANVSVGWD